MKKYIGGLVLLLILAFISACGQNQNNEISSSEETSVTIQSTTEETTTIVEETQKEYLINCYTTSEVLMASFNYEDWDTPEEYQNFMSPFEEAGYYLVDSVYTEESLNLYFEEYEDLTTESYEYSGYVAEDTAYYNENTSEENNNDEVITINYYGTWYPEIGAPYSAIYENGIDFLNSGAGIIYMNGWAFTYYSELVLPGEGLQIPGRWSDYSTGFVRDGDGYICVGSEALYYNYYGAIIQTPFGLGRVYDCGGDSGVIDLYVCY